MPVVFVAGRVLFVLYFIFTGLQRLMNVKAGAELLATKLTVPVGITTLMAPIESAVGLSTLQIAALLLGAIELFAALLIAFNVCTRIMAGVLIVFTVLVSFYGNDFWNLPDGQREAAILQAVLHISLIGGLLVFFGLGYAKPGEPGRPQSV